MSMTGTLDEVLSKLYELYVDNRMNDDAVHRYLLLLTHPDGSKVFGDEDAEKLLKQLKKDKEAKIK